VTEKKLADFRYSLFIAAVSDIYQGHQIWGGEGGRAITVIVGWLTGIPDLLNDCAIF